MEEWDDLVIFDKKNIKKSSEKFITIYKTTADTVNMAFSSAMARSIEEDYINLAYSKSKQSIVIFLHTLPDANSFKLNKRPRGIVLSIQRFLNNFGLKKEEVIGRYIPKEDIIGDILVWIISLDQKDLKPET